MARHLELRPLTRSEQRMLRSKLRDLALSVRVHQRYRVIDQVHRGFSLLATAERVGCHFTVAYDWVHRFNESGFATFEQVPNPKGRPPILRAAQLRELIDVALSSPSERGLPFSVWSVSKLAEYCRRRKLLPAVTDEWVRRLLRREGLTAQRARTWKTSTHPRSTVKKKLIRALYRRCPSRSAVVCFDEWGLLDLKPVGGVAWARHKQPWRIRATYRRLQGTEQFWDSRMCTLIASVACFVVTNGSWTSAKPSATSADVIRASDCS
jgi:transposase